MLEHPNPPDLLAAYVDDELDPPTREAVAQHLAACARCRQDVEGQQQIKRLLHGAPATIAIPAGLVTRVRAGAYETTVSPVGRGARSWLPAFPRWAAAPAFALVLLLAVFGLGLFGIGPFAGPSAAAQTAEMSLKDHAMCEQMGGVTHGYTGTLTLVTGKLADEMKMPIAVPAEVPQTYHFEGGHDVTLGPADAAHLAWMSDHHMLSLYQAKDPGGAPPAGWTRSVQGGREYWLGPAGTERAAFWRQAGMLYLLIGNLSDADLLASAGSVGVP